MLETLTVLPGAAHAAAIENSPVLLKKPSPIRTCRCHLAPHRCGDQVQCWENGPDVCGFIKPPDSREKWQVRLHGAFSIHHNTLAFREKDQSCHHEVWMHLALANFRGDHAPQYKHDQRVHLTPYDINKERSRVHREQSNHSHNS